MRSPRRAAASSCASRLKAAAGAFDVADPMSAALLCYASMHALDPGFRGGGEPDDARLTRAARHLFRRAVGPP